MPAITSLAISNQLDKTKMTYEKSKFFMVWKEGSNCNSPSYKHPDYELAKQECMRLTRLHGGTFHILAQVASATKTDVQFEELYSDGIPF